jgi:hypothetical protein
MANTVIPEVLVFRELSRTDDAGVVTTVDLIIGKPVPFQDPPSGFVGFICSVQILGLQPARTGEHISKGFKFFDARSLDPLDAILKAVYSARAILDASPEGKAGQLVWKNMSTVPGYGMPKKVIELTEFVRSNYVNMSANEQAFWGGLLDGVPITKNAMVTSTYQAFSWSELQPKPVTALQSVSAADAATLQHLGITTIADLADYLPFRIASAIVQAANPKNPLLG